DATLFVVVALSGFCALGAEVVWTRLLSLLLGPSVYTFSIVLACFLAGLGLGNAAGVAVARRTPDPRRTLGWCQFALTAAVTLGAQMVLSVFAQRVYTPPADFLTVLGADVMSCAATLLPAAFLWGASIPLALAARSPHERDRGRLAGGVYAFNTFGALLGAT